MEPEVGLEPTTYALQMRCSTVELLRHIYFYFTKKLEIRKANLVALSAEFFRYLRKLFLQFFIRRPELNSRFIRLFGIG